MRLPGYVVAMTLALAGAANAQPASTIPTDVQGLYNACRSAQGTRESVICGQYISGIGDLLVLNGGLRDVVSAAAWRTVAKLAICASPTHTEMRHAFTTWAARHAGDGSKVRSVGVITALREAWPCSLR
jgi:hypothetical protein